MTTLLQVSDPHFGTERAAVVGALIRLAGDIRPDLCVLSGDITQRARRRQFASAGAFVRRLAVPAILAIPGNHDVPLFNVLARVLAPYANFRRTFGPDLEPLFQTPDLLVVGVKTTRRWRHADGEVSPTQIARVAARLERAGALQLRVVVVHQPVLAIEASDQRNLLHGHRQAIPVWAAAGVDIVMGGHIHLPYARPLSDSFAGLPRVPWTVQAGTAVSERLRGGVDNSVNVLRCRAGSGERLCEVERWDYESAADRFELHSSHALAFRASQA